MKRSYLNAAFSFAIALGISSLHAGDNKAPVTENGTATEEEESSAKNSIELEIGGVNIGGDDAQFKQEHRISGDWFGGIEDLHYESSVGKGTLTIHGHSIFATGDHNSPIEFTQTGSGFVRRRLTPFPD